MKQIENDIMKEESYIQSITKSKQMHHINILFKKDTTLHQLTAVIKTLGEVVMSSGACNIPILKRRNKQAQIIVPHSTNKFDNVSHKLTHTIQTKMYDVRGCTFLPDGIMVFANCNSNQVSVFKPDGSADFDFKHIGTVWDVLYIQDNSIAVASVEARDSKQINKIDFANRKVKKNH